MLGSKSGGVGSSFLTTGYSRVGDHVHVRVQSPNFAHQESWTALTCVQFSHLIVDPVWQILPHHYHSGTMFAFFTNPLCQTMLDPSDPPGHHPPSQPHHTTVHQAAVIFFDTLKDIKSFPKSYFSLVSCCSKTKF